MRRGTNPEWLIEDGKVVGVNLSADYCAEHEWGTGDLQRLLGLDAAAPHGIERRRISKPQNIRLYEHKDQALLLCEAAWVLDRFDEDIKKLGKAKAFKDERPRELGLWGDATLAAAWDGGSFGLLGKGDDAKRIKDLWEEAQKRNVALWVAGVSNPFARGGLIIAVVDRVAAKHLEAMRAADEDAEKLQAASDATGIIARLRAANKGFFACSPRWFDGTFKPQNEVKKTSFPVIYWLNPQEQDRNNFGWFTVEELDLWIKGSGPIPKAMEKAR